MSMASSAQPLVRSCSSVAISRDSLSQLGLPHRSCCAAGLRTDSISRRSSEMSTGFSPSSQSLRSACCCTIARDSSATSCAGFTLLVTSSTNVSGTAFRSWSPKSCGIPSLATQLRQGLGFNLPRPSVRKRGPAPPWSNREGGGNTPENMGQPRINRISPPGLGQFRPPPTAYVPNIKPSEEEKANVAIRTKILVEKLREGQGSWQERATFVKELQKLGVTSEDLYSMTFVPMVKQLEMVVAAQVYDSLVQSGASPELLEQWDEFSLNLLYALRTLSARQRCSAAEYVMDNSLSVEEAQKLAWAIKDHERRPVGRTGFTPAPGDCLAFMFHRQAIESQDIEQKMILVEQGLKVAATDTAKERFSEFSL